MGVLSKEITENTANVINALRALTPKEAQDFAKLIRHEPEYKQYADIFNGYKKA